MLQLPHKAARERERERKFDSGADEYMSCDRAAGFPPNKLNIIKYI